MSEESQLPGERGTGTISGFRLCTQAVRRESRGAQSQPFRFKQRLFDHIKAIQIDQTYRSHFWDSETSALDATDITWIADTSTCHQMSPGCCTRTSTSAGSRVWQGLAGSGRVWQGLAAWYCGLRSLVRNDDWTVLIWFDCVKLCLHSVHADRSDRSRCGSAPCCWRSFLVFARRWFRSWDGSKSWARSTRPETSDKMDLAALAMYRNLLEVPWCPMEWCSFELA